MTAVRRTGSITNHNTIRVYTRIFKHKTEIDHLTVPVDEMIAACREFLVRNASRGARQPGGNRYSWCRVISLESLLVVPGNLVGIATRGAGQPGWNRYSWCRAIWLESLLVVPGNLVFAQLEKPGCIVV